MADVDGGRNLVRRALALASVDAACSSCRVDAPTSEEAAFSQRSPAARCGSFELEAAVLLLLDGSECCVDIDETGGICGIPFICRSPRRFRWLVRAVAAFTVGGVAGGCPLWVCRGGAPCWVTTATMASNRRATRAAVGCSPAAMASSSRYTALGSWPSDNADVQRCSSACPACPAAAAACALSCTLPARSVLRDPASIPLCPMDAVGRGLACDAEPLGCCLWLTAPL